MSESEKVGTVNNQATGINNGIIIYIDDLFKGFREKQFMYLLVILVLLVSISFGYVTLKKARVENRLRDSIQSINQVDLHKIRIDTMANLNTIGVDKDVDDSVINKNAYMHITPLLVEIDTNIMVNTVLIKNSEISFGSIEKLVEANKELQKARGDIEDLIKGLVKTYKENKVVKNNNTAILQYY